MTPRRPAGSLVEIVEALARQAERRAREQRREAARLDRDLERIVHEAAAGLIAQLQAVGIEHADDLARRLNRRGLPCFGRRRWSAASVAAVMRRAFRNEAA